MNGIHFPQFKDKMYLIFSTAECSWNKYILSLDREKCTPSKNTRFCLTAIFLIQVHNLSTRVKKCTIYGASIRNRLLWVVFVVEWPVGRSSWVEGCCLPCGCGGAVRCPPLYLHRCTDSAATAWNDFALVCYALASRTPPRCVLLGTPQKFSFLFPSKLFLSFVFLLSRFFAFLPSFSLSHVSLFSVDPSFFVFLPLPSLPFPSPRLPNHAPWLGPCAQRRQRTDLYLSYFRPSRPPDSAKGEWAAKILYSKIHVFIKFTATSSVTCHRVTRITILGRNF